ncbi:sulfite exporter TauE/SafE family protein [Candidatus Puniceispirillum marinum]|nr:sulfite exporter TauE/SafE family protein [Candidatus Puniceispirillum marinum]
MTGFEIVAESPFLFWVMAAMSVLMLSVAKSGFGGALASTSVPILLFVLPPKLALAVLLPIFLLTDIGVLFIWYKFCNWRIVSIMCLFALLGQVAGWLLFDYFTDVMLTALIGVVAVVTGVKYWIDIIRNSALSVLVAYVDKRIWQRAALWCGLSGISSFISLSGGIPAQVFLLPHRVSRQAFVGTFSVYFMVIDLLKTPLYLQLDLFTNDSLHISAMLLPVVPIGVFLGWWLNKRMNDRIFYHISHGVLLLMGLKLLVDAFTG